MESLDETSKNISSRMGFFKHVFNFDEESKAEIFNLIQYSTIALIPVVILNKAMQKYVPEADEEKGSFELLAEVMTQISVMFIGILLINRIITYVPTYSGIKYPDFSVTYIILAVLVITMSLQTKLGEKVSILFDRVVELWDGKPEKNTKKGKKGSVKISQPISGQQQTHSSDNSSQMAMNQSLYGGGGGGESQGTTSISQLPMTSGGQSMPDYNTMHRNDSTPLVAAASPGDPFSGMIMAANEALGGSAFGSNF
jgi:hypothetical protein